MILAAKTSSNIFLSFRDFSLTDFPTELQLQLMEEDDMQFAHDELQPDEQQLEVLEDIWLKAGEIGKMKPTVCAGLQFYYVLFSFVEAEDASVCDAGYNVKHRRKYFSKKRKSSKDREHRPPIKRAGGGKKKLSKENKAEAAARRREQVDQSSNELTGLYRTCQSKDKKVCGKIVAPLLLTNDSTNTDTDDLVKSLVAQAEDKLLHKRKKHKHKDPDKHKHKKRECF